LVEQEDVTMGDSCDS
jgi:hypothetical protein